MSLADFGEDENELIGEIYEAALDGEKWPRTLFRLRELSNAKDCNLIFHDSQSRHRNTVVSSTLPETVLSEYLDHFIDEDIFWGRKLYSFNQGSADVISSEEVGRRTGQERDRLQESELARWYRETLQYGDQLALFLLVENFSLAALTVNRGIGQSPVEVETHRLLKRLKPHFMRALSIHHQLSITRQEQASIQEVLERTAGGVILLDGSERVVFSNREALRIVDRGDRLQVVGGGRLAGASPKIDKVLQVAIKNCEEQRKYFKAAVTSFSVPHPDYRQPLQISVVPVLSDTTALRQLPTLIFLIDPARRWTVSNAYMQKAYRLTPAECAVSAALAGGDSVRHIAAQREVTEGTVREQLNSILEKTSSATQRELALLLFNLRDDFARPVG